MSKLYSTYANVYHEMYQHIFDYKKEFVFYNNLLKKIKCKSLLEVGCGTGLLGKKFLCAGYNYLGLDLYSEMVEIAKTESNSNRFVQGDMRNLNLEERFDSVLITGRSISYILENQNIVDTMNGVHGVLNNDGIFIFDVFNAKEIFKCLNDFEQNIELNSKKITRINKLRKNLNTGWTYDWIAKYIVYNGKDVMEFDDIITLRSFTKDEISLFLNITGFKIIEIFQKKRILTFIAKKLN